ncbi:TolC family outer membrane protein [Sphingomonas bacterium]|uniref:TolC family outer membrane protein n=1 Tax=Sphingomonas bacterium TaxID=1895847 RepID=UPI001576B21B|nr:TolC family outer membrane protein [Sphingomonas bacterium]
MTRPLRFIAGLSAGAVLLAAPVAADTLGDALLKAYRTSPTLTAAQAAQRATDEGVPIARAAGLPSVGVNGGYVQNAFGTSNSLASPERQATGQTALTIPVYTGGLVRSTVLAAQTRVEAGQIGLRSTESTLFTAVVAAYMDAIRDEAIVGLNQQNVHVLDVNLQATRDRFQVGDLTRTDVAQSEARLSLARAQFQSVQANLIASRENYIRVVGSPPGALQPPPLLPRLPDTPDAAVEVALKQNPTLLAFQKQRDATAFDVDAARQRRLPRVSAVFGGNYYNYLGSLGVGTGVRVGQDALSGTIGATVNLPIFSGGAVSAGIRQAQAQRTAAVEQATDAERGVIATTRAAYAVWRSSEQVIQSAQQAVNANKLSLEGVRAENSVGSRTILDILNAEQELLNSQVTLVTAQRDAYVAGFALLAAMGQAQAGDLGLGGGPLYDPVAHYLSVRRRVFGVGDDTDRVTATSTASTPAQNAELTKPLDPALDTPVDSNPHLTTGEHAPGR